MVINSFVSLLSSNLTHCKYIEVYICIQQHDYMVISIYIAHPYDVNNEKLSFWVYRYKKCKSTADVTAVYF